MAWAPLNLDEPPPDDAPGHSFAQKRVRYDDDEDDFDVGRRRRAREAELKNPTNAGMIGFIMAGVSLGLLVVVAILWVFLKQENQANNAPEQMERTRWMLYWFLFLDVISFVAALCATIFGARGVAPSNPLFRGYAIGALIAGILEMVATILFGLFMTCSVFVFEVFRNMG